MAHYHEERPYQGKGNVILFPSAHTDRKPKGPIQCRERLAGLLKYYHHKVA
jgi:putative transposase